jgi:hypothetical protein
LTITKKKGCEYRQYLLRRCLKHIQICITGRLVEVTWIFQNQWLFANFPLPQAFPCFFIGLEIPLYTLGKGQEVSALNIDHEGANGMTFPSPPEGQCQLYFFLIKIIKHSSHINLCVF